MNLFTKSQVLIMSVFLLFLFILIPLNAVQGYYGYGGLYGSFNNYMGTGTSLGYTKYYNLGGLYGSGLYGGLYGGGLYGGLYGGLLGGLYGGLLGGLYGGGLYGGGLLGGLYGSSLYGGLYGGLYGSSLYGGLLGGLYGGGLFGGYSGFGTRFGLAEQTGLWEGLWSTGILSGPITINLVEDPVIAGLVTGFVQLIGNTVLPTLVSVTGEIVNDQIILTGDNGLAGGKFVVIDITGALLSPTEIEGDYVLTLANLGTVAETGKFQVTLTTPII